MLFDCTLKYFFFAEPLRDDVVGVTPNEKYYTLLTFNQNYSDQVNNNPDQVYFANSTENINEQYILILLFTFGSLKFMCSLFYWLSRLNPVFLSPCKYLSDRTRSLCFFLQFAGGESDRNCIFQRNSINFGCEIGLFCFVGSLVLCSRPLPHSDLHNTFRPITVFAKNKKTKFLVIRSKLS